jgi:hypothetical protein
MQTQTKTHATTTFTTSTRTAMPTETTTQVTTLRASQVDAVAEEEIHWFFTCTDNDQRSAEARAIIDSWLGAVDPADQQALALRYEPMPSPPALEEEWQDGFALALSLAATQWRPNGLPRPALERLASDQLEDAVRRHGKGVLRGIARRADWDFSTAVRAYAKVRGRAPSVLPRRAA